MKKAVSRRRAAVGPGILAFAVVIVLSLLTVSCGHGKSVGSGLAPTGQKTGAPRHAPTLASILAEIDAYPTPKGVDAARFEALRAELRRQVIAQRSGKTISAAPTGSWDALSDLNITTDTQGTQATLTWTEKLWGDFDNNGEVAIGDLLPVALYYFERTDEGPNDAHKLVQGDTDPEININDLSAIVWNYGAHLVGYRIYRGQQVGSYILWDTTWRPNPNTNNPDWSADRPYPPPTSTRPSYTYVDDISGLLNKTNVRYKVVAYGDSEEGVTTDPAVMPPPGTFYISGTITWWGNGVPNVIIQATGGHSGTSGPAGLYKVFGLTNGSYTLTPSLPSWSFTPSTFQVSVSGGNVTNVNFNATPGLADTAWPKFRANARNTGLSTHTGPQTNAVKWTFTTTPGADMISSPVVGTDGTVFVGSAERDLRFYALNPADGSLVWGWFVGDYFSSTPAVCADGIVYAPLYDGTIFGFYGAWAGYKWQYAPGGTIYSSPAIGGDGTIFIGCQDSNVYALYPNGGAIKWTYTTGGSVDSSPALGSNGTIYIGSKDGYLYALNPSSGSLIWRTNVGQVESAPAVGTDGTIYVGTFSSPTDGPRVYALNPDGTVKWYYPTGGWVESSPGIGPDGTVYVGCDDKYVYALNPSNGSLRWAYQTGNWVGPSSPAIGADRTVYIGSCDKKVYAINGYNGTLKWSYETGAEVMSSPAIGSDGTLYVTSADGVIYAFGS